MNKETNKKADEILNSLEGMKRATAPDFFFTRLRSRMEKEYEPLAKKQRVLRPAYAFAALLVVLLINVAVLFQNSRNSDTTATATIDTDSIQALASEYSVTDAGSVYDLNLEK